VKARQILHRKRVYDDGATLEMILWEVAEPVQGSSGNVTLDIPWPYR